MDEVLENMKKQASLEHGRLERERCHQTITIAKCFYALKRKEEARNLLKKTLELIPKENKPIETGAKGKEKEKELPGQTEIDQDQAKRPWQEIEFQTLHFLSEYSEPNSDEANECSFPFVFDDAF